ncbi:MAG: hypothetical protein S4CHLAM2_13630 [Chlamydiales bacterium]|nr:hypothetical protein [Chlamydiales bacterium]
MAAAAAGTSNDLNSVAFIQDIFPQSEYQSKKTAGLAAHYLIALDQPLACIKNFLSKKISKLTRERTGNEDLDNAAKVRILAQARGEIVNRTSEVKYGLTMAHVAVLAQRIDVLRDLQKLGADPQKTDYLGWNLAHHAIVIANGDTENEIVKFVVEWMGGEEVAGQLQNRYRGSYKDFEALLKFDPALPDDAVVCKAMGADGEVKECTAREFKEISGGREYVPKVVATPQGLYEHWKSRTYNELVSTHNDPVAPITDAYGIVKRERVGHTLVATADTAQGVFLKTFYGGEFKHEEDKPQPGEPERIYDLKIVSAEEQQSELAKMNCGFPNLELLTVAERGIPQIAFRTVAPVRRGDQLLWNYGGEYALDHTFPMFELDPEALIRYVRDESLAVKIESFPSIPALVHFATHDTRANYICTHPAAWITLYDNDLISLIKLIFGVLDLFDQNKTVERLIICLKSLINLDYRLPSADKTAFKDCLKSWNRSLSTMSMMTAMGTLSGLLRRRLQFDKAIQDTNQIIKILGFFRFQEDNSAFLGDEEYLSKSRESYDALSSDQSKRLCLETLKAYADQAKVQELAEIHTLLSD